MRCSVCLSELKSANAACPVCSSRNGNVAVAADSSASEATLLSIPQDYMGTSETMDTLIWAEETLIGADTATGPISSVSAPSAPSGIASFPGITPPPTPTPSPQSHNSYTPTPLHPTAPGSSTGPSHQSTGSGSSGFMSDDQELVPGTLLVGRYRVVSPLGRGGMGRVYRAEDLKLGQTVALKFLPPSMSNDPAWLARFFSEVRTAREVTHANVCRVHDIVEIENPSGPSIHFLTMEYVDGENLSALLKRFGRLPTQKAMEMASQITAGLAAAHAKGVLHRDLKPANIMVDGKGHAKITDFGLAVVATDGSAKEVAGTPGYMAPELFKGIQASGRSDLYALGIVLYELFAGRQPWPSKDPKDRQQPPTPLRRYAPKLSGDIEHVIMQCLSANVADRPISAAHVLQEFPAVDLLAAAVARGETLSIDALASAAQEEPIPLLKAWILMGVAVFGIAACLFLSPRATVLGVSPPGLSFDEIHRRMQETLRALHLPDRARTQVSYLMQNGTIEDYYSKNPKEIARSAQGPLILTSRLYDRGSLLPLQFGPRVLFTIQDPAPTRPGMISIDMDSNGRLMRFLYVPEDGSSPTAPAPDLNLAFYAAGLDPKLMHPTNISLTPSVPLSRQLEFEGTAPGHPDVPIRFDVGSFGSQFTYIRVITPWNKPIRNQLGFVAASWGEVVLYIAFFACAIPLVRRNLAMRRGDTRGAYMLGASIMGLFVGSSMFGFSPSNGSDAAFTFILTKIGYGLLSGAIAWLGYVAIEPFARKRVPRLLISSTLMLQRKYTSLVVTRDVLLGSALGIGCAGVEFALTTLLKPVIPSIELWPSEPLLLGGVIQWLHSVIGLAGTVLLNVGLAVPVFVIFRVMLRRTWAAAALLCSLLVLAHVSSHGSFSNLLVEGVWGILLGILIARVGTVSASVFVFVSALMEKLPWTTDTSNWMAPSMFCGIVVIGGLVGWSFHHALGDQKAFGFIHLDD